VHISLRLPSPHYLQQTATAATTTTTTITTQTKYTKKKAAKSCSLQKVVAPVLDR
jgi:hypothetical protein